MILNFNGIVLKTIELDDIEMLRNWRNDSKIAKKMFYKKYITKEMQLTWFRNLRETDFYFIIQYKNTPVGLINLIDEDKIKLEAQVGLFIYNENYWGGPISIFASLALLQFAFEERKLQKVYAKVQASNTAVQKYNEQLGFNTYNENYQTLCFKNYQTIAVNLINKIKKGKLKL